MLRSSLVLKNMFLISKTNESLLSTLISGFSRSIHFLVTLHTEVKGHGVYLNDLHCKKWVKSITCEDSGMRQKNPGNYLIFHEETRAESRQADGYELTGLK